MELFAVCESKEEYGLDKLPLEILLLIFDYLDLSSLATLATTCQRLCSAINDKYLKYKSTSLLVTNQYSVEIQKRSLRLLCPLNKYQTNRRWRKKYYEERVFLQSIEKFRPWLSLTEHGVFVGRGHEIYLFGRNKRGIKTKPIIAFRGHSDDISRFVVRDQLMVSSGNDGKLCCWDVKRGTRLFSADTPVAWNETVYVDWSDHILATGFNMAGVVKFFGLEDTGFVYRSQIEENERVWSVALNVEGNFCSIGSAGYRSSPLKIYDLHRGAYTLTVPEKYKVGAGVFHTIWESPQILISGSYDTYIRMWDLRTGGCVRSWSDPYDAAIYSLATDHHWTILAGTSLHGRVTLWDKRLPQCVQMYYMKSAENGPVYSLDFDPSYLFVALESSLHVLDFSQPTREAGCSEFRNFRSNHTSPPGSYYV